MGFAETFLSARQRRNHSQRQAAIAVGRSSASIALWETGERRPSPDLFPKLAEYLDVDEGAVPKLVIGDLEERVAALELRMAQLEARLDEARR